MEQPSREGAGTIIHTGVRALRARTGSIRRPACAGRFFAAWALTQRVHLPCQCRRFLGVLLIVASTLSPDLPTLGGRQSESVVSVAPGAVMGAATPVTGEGKQVDEKAISAARKTFTAPAELRGRDPRVAEAIEGLVEAGEPLPLTATGSLAWRYTDGVAPDRRELLHAAALPTATVQEVRPGPAENVAAFLTNPVIASLLFALGALCLLGTILLREVSLLTGAGLGMLALFFWSHFVDGLAGWEGVVLVVLGLVLLGVELSIVPGFGIAGVLGAVALLGGLFLSVLGREVVTPADLQRAALTVGATAVLLLAGGGVALSILPQGKRLRR